MKDIKITILSFNVVDFNQKFHDLGSFLWNMKEQCCVDFDKSANNVIVTQQDVQAFGMMNVNAHYRELCLALLQGMHFKQFPALHLFKEKSLESSIIKA